MSERDYYGRFFLFRHIEEFLAMCRSEIAHPASTESQFGSSKTQMLNGNGDIDVTVALSVLAYPLLIVEDRCDDIHWGCSEPFPVIAFTEFVLAFLALNDAEAPRLFVYGRWCEAHTFLDILKLLVADCLCGVVSAAITVFYDF
jgi:hypothetical protein